MGEGGRGRGNGKKIEPHLYFTISGEKTDSETSGTVGGRKAFKKKRWVGQEGEGKGGEDGASPWAALGVMGGKGKGRVGCLLESRPGGAGSKRRGRKGKRGQSHPRVLVLLGGLVLDSPGVAWEKKKKAATCSPLILRLPG